MTQSLCTLKVIRNIYERPSIGVYSGGFSVSVLYVTNILPKPCLRFELFAPDVTLKLAHLANCCIIGKFAVNCAKQRLLINGECSLSPEFTHPARTMKT